MFRIFMLSTILVGILYFLPFATGTQQLDEIVIPVLSEFNVENIINITTFENLHEKESIIVCIDGENKEIDIDEFLVGVVCAEMPASFEIEALKAQAVAGRTYIYYKEWLMSQDVIDSVHPDAVVCNNPAHCKAYVNLEEQNPFGDSYELYKTKIENSVYSTSKEYVIYDDEPIAAVFHSTSSENTERAVDVWGTDIPYLQSVSSLGSQSSPNYKSSVNVSLDDFKKIILNNFSDADLTGDKETWFRASTRSESGGVISVYIGGVLVDGIAVRTLFSLNSTNFTIDFTDDYIIFNTTGYGHGVGLSQYGANALAKDCLDYIDILKWYYIDTEITKK